MSRLKLVRGVPMPPLYDRIGYETALEALAFRRLADFDVDGARAAFGRLVDQLDLAPGRARGREVVLLLHDVLQRIHRRLHRPPDADPQYQVTRVAMIEQFAALEDPEEARRAFLPTVHRLLAPLRTRPAAAHPLVERAQAYIEDHYQGRVGLSAVARQLHVSANYLSRLFRKEAGMTLTAYVHRVRLEHARMLLAAGDHTISEIAYLVGYQTYRDFYRNFVKYERSSPRQARRRLADPQPAPLAAAAIPAEEEAQ
ncbi:MAG TPA: AraC family transcriptional regulator [Candidatus Polarisedimenticolaceae bacterium]